MCVCARARVCACVRVCVLLVFLCVPVCPEGSQPASSASLMGQEGRKAVGVLRERNECLDSHYPAGVEEGAA